MDKRNYAYKLLDLDNILHRMQIFLLLYKYINVYLIILSKFNLSLTLIILLHFDANLYIFEALYCGVV